MLETVVLAMLGSGGVVGLFFFVIRFYIEKKLKEADAREKERLQAKIDMRKVDDEISHATGRVLFWLHHAITHDGEHNGELEDAFKAYQEAENKKKEMDREILAKYSL